MPDKQNTAAMAHDVPMGDIELDPKAFEGIDVERSLQTARRPKYVKEPTLIGRAAEGGKYEVCSGAAWLLIWGRPDTANVLLADLGAAASKAVASASVAAQTQAWHDCRTLAETYDAIRADGGRWGTAQVPSVQILAWALDWSTRKVSMALKAGRELPDALAALFDDELLSYKNLLEATALSPGKLSYLDYLCGDAGRAPLTIAETSAALDEVRSMPWSAADEQASIALGALARLELIRKDGGRPSDPFASRLRSLGLGR